MSRIRTGEFGREGFPRGHATLARDVVHTGTAATRFARSSPFFSPAARAPVGIRKADPREVQIYLTLSALTDDVPSDFSLNELRHYDLLESFEDDPEGALAKLHDAALEDGLPPDELFALAELSFLRAEETKRPFGHLAHHGDHILRESGFQIQSGVGRPAWQIYHAEGWSAPPPITASRLARYRAVEPIRGQSSRGAASEDRKSRRPRGLRPSGVASRSKTREDPP